MSELKPCPFCGYTETSLERNNNYVGYQCKGCSASPEWDLGESGARDKWNTRPLEDALIAERDLLRQQLEIAKEALKKIEFYSNSDWSHTQIAKDALKQLEAE